MRAFKSAERLSFLRFVSLLLVLLYRAVSDMSGRRMSSKYWEMTDLKLAIRVIGEPLGVGGEQ